MRKADSGENYKSLWILWILKKGEGNIWKKLGQHIQSEDYKMSAQIKSIFLTNRLGKVNCDRIKTGGLR